MGLLSLPVPVCSATPEASERREDHKLGETTKMDLSSAPHLWFAGERCPLGGQDGGFKLMGVQGGVSLDGAGASRTGLGSVTHQHPSREGCERKQS